MQSPPDGPMLQDVRRQPAALACLVDRAGEVHAFADETLRPGPGGAVWATGCGDGWFAARAVAALAEAAGTAYRPRAALEFLVYDAPALGPADRVVIVSMSGNVDRVVEAAEAAAARGAVVSLITNGDGGRVGALGCPRFSLGLEPVAPFLCGTATYTASVAALALALGPPGTDAGAARVVDGLAACLEASESTVHALARDYPAVRFLSAGVNLASADYGAAKLVELTRVPAWSDDVEEFAHRQFWAASREELIVFLPGNPAVAAHANASAAALGEMGFATLALEPAGCAVPAAAHRIALPVNGEALSPLAMALPLQLLAHALARATGLDPDTRAHLKGDEVRFRTSRRLTRTSLLGTGQ